MDGSDFYHHHHHHQHQQPHQHQHQHQNSNTAATTTTTNGIFTSSEVSPLIFSQSSSAGRSPPAASAGDTVNVKRKRGRPRKYGPGGYGDGPPPSASKKTSSSAAAASSSPSLPLSSSSPPPPPPSTKKDSSSSKKSNLDSPRNAGQGFTPHVIAVAAGEDVAQKIMSFMQQRKRAVCILSASGSISNASLRQPATYGGNVTVEGRFEILSLSGSYLVTEMDGASSRTGGLSICLSGADGRIIGGGVAGPLEAAGPVQVIAGSFVFDMNKELNSAVNPEASGQLFGGMVSPVSYRSTPDPSARIIARGHDDHRNIGGSGFTLQSRPMHVMHRSNLDVELTDGHPGEDGDD